MTVALCLLAWNEIDGVKHDVPLIDKIKFGQVYCIDGGSTDGTVEYLQQNGIAVYRQSAKGLNQACWDGAERCTCDAFVFFHPKGTIPVEDAYRFRAFFEDGYEFIVASRNMNQLLGMVICFMCYGPCAHPLLVLGVRSWHMDLSPLFLGIIR